MALNWEIAKIKTECLMGTSNRQNEISKIINLSLYLYIHGSKSFFHDLSRSGKWWTEILWWTLLYFGKSLRRNTKCWQEITSTWRNLFVCLFVCGATAPQWAMASSFTRFLDHTQRRTTVGRTPLDEWSARHRDLYLTTHNTHNRQISMPPVGFEPTISAVERPQTYALDRAATGTSWRNLRTI